MKKERYESSELEIIRFSTTDVIMTSFDPVSDDQEGLPING